MMRNSVAKRGRTLALALLTACSSMGVHAQTSLPAATSIKGPQDLPYYDVAWAKGLTLESMHARIVSRDAVDGIDILAVEYDAFDQPIAAANGLTVVRWRQRAWLVLPPAPLRDSKALALSIHDGDAGRKDNARSFLGMALGVAKAFGIPVLIHGWMPDVVKSVDGRSFHNTEDLVMQRLLAAHLVEAADLPMDGRYLFNGNPLVKADMVSLTLLQRLVERERGSNVTEFASLGISKEGGSHWVLGAIDDRVTVLGAGGYYAHDARETYDRYGKDTGWRLPWKGGDLPEYDGLRSLFATFWRFCDWSDKTEAGKLLARTTMDPARWYDDIRARHVVVFGDLGLTPGQHDGPWPFWAENKPLATFKHPSWRYVRVFDGSGVFMDAKGIGDMGLSMMPQLADLLVNDNTMPGTPSVDVAQVADRQVVVRARASVSPGLQHEALVLYAMSAERGLRNPESWHTASMREINPGAWELKLPVVPDGQALTLMVVVRERAIARDLSYWRSASSLPVERFPVPEFNLPGPRWTE